MFKHEISYTDFNGQERTEDHYFHLSLPELTRLEAEIGEELEPYINRLVADADVKKLLDFLERILLTSYGKKSTDGRSFMKNREIREEFEYSQAYAELFEDLLTSPDLAKEFGAKVADKGVPEKSQITPKVVEK